MTPELSPAPPSDRWPAGHRSALCVSIDVDGPYGELNYQPPANWYDISQTDYDPTGVDRLLHLLADIDVRGTFCWVGRAAEDEPDLVRRAVAEGHELALHSWDHRGYRSMSPAEQREDLLRASTALIGVSGQIPAGHKTASWNFDDTTPLWRRRSARVGNGPAARRPAVAAAAGRDAPAAGQPPAGQTL
jgi:peptidoglycan/xylan/chitin deacetylase (PgdA/CDA1 family)